MSGTSMDSTSYADGALGLFLDVFAYPLFSKRREAHLEELPGKYLRLRVGYQFSGTPASAEDPFTQSLIVTQLDGRIILPYAFLFTLRNRFDYRFKNDNFSMRYRPRLTLQRDFHTEFLFFTISNFVEYYANFGESELNRFRYQLGCEFKISRHLSYESFWNHQFANEPKVGSVNAFGMSLKLYLQAKGNKEAKQK
jgi:hypothetical protein